MSTPVTTDHALWRRIEAAFDEDEALEPYTCLRELGLEAPSLQNSLQAHLGQLLEQTFQEEPPTAEIGGTRYRVLERLDTGGQSDVYLAERADGVYDRTVVIKLLAARYDQEIAKAQLRREMQLLADLGHPGIVQILDGGFGDGGRPWLVLEKVDGPHIDAHCRTSSPDIRAIVILFRELCDALRFVHLRDIVHMDIKPANVLVRDIGGASYPVLIDFGIALEAAGMGEARQGARFGTPGFAAPEQLAGQPVDPRADLYALGMLLAQLLLDGATENAGLLAPDERARLLQERGVPRDLVDVINRCTAENPKNRYPSAEALRTDLDAWLNGFPLEASRHRRFHVLGKALRRHALAASVAALALLSGLVFTVKYAADIQELQAVTLSEKKQSDNLVNFMLGDLFERLTDIGRIDLLSLVADRSLEHLAQQDPRLMDDDARLLTSIAYRNTGQVLDALEQPTRAQQAFEQAALNLAPLANDPARERDWLRQRAALLILESDSRATAGQESETADILREAGSLSQQLVRRYGEGHELLWEANLLLGWHLMEYDDSDGAEQALNTALEIAEAQDIQPGDHQWLISRSHNWQALAWFAYDYGDPAEAEPAMRRAILEAERAVEAASAVIETHHNLRVIINQLAFLLTQNGQIDEAARVTDRAIDIGNQLRLMAPQNLEYERELAYSFTTRGEIAELQGDLDEAQASYAASVAISRRLAAEDPGSFTAANDLAIDLIGLGQVLSLKGAREAADTLWREAAELMSPVLAQEPDNKYYQYTLATALLRLGRLEEARPLVRNLLEAGMDDDAFRALLVDTGLN